MQTYLGCSTCSSSIATTRAPPSRTPGTSQLVDISRELGLDEWLDELHEDEMRYALACAWEGLEVMRELGSRGRLHPFVRYRATLEGERSR